MVSRFSPGTWNESPVSKWAGRHWRWSDFPGHPVHDAQQRLCIAYMVAVVLDPWGEALDRPLGCAACSLDPNYLWVEITCPAHMEDVSDRIAQPALSGAELMATLPLELRSRCGLAFVTGDDRVRISVRVGR